MRSSFVCSNTISHIMCIVLNVSYNNTPCSGVTKNAITEMTMENVFFLQLSNRRASAQYTNNVKNTVDLKSNVGKIHAYIKVYETLPPRFQRLR